MSRSIASKSMARPALVVLMTLLAALLLLPNRSAADEPGEDNPPVISNGIVTPGILSYEGGEISIGADVTDDFGVTSVFAEVIGSDGSYRSAAMEPTGGSSYSASIDIPPNFNEGSSVSYSIYVWASDTNEGSSSELVGEIEVGEPPQFDEAPAISEPSVNPRQLPAAGGSVTVRAYASDNRSVSEVYATFTPLDGGNTTQIEMEPIDFNRFEGVFSVPANLGTTPERYEIEMTALDDIGQPDSVPAGRLTVGAPSTPACTGSGVAGNGANSVLQRKAQKLWGSAFATEICPGTVTPRFNPTATNNRADFLGTEMPPSAAQIPAMTGGAGASLAVIPVAQTAIAIVAHPPHDCSIEKITNRQLELVFRGSIELWSQLHTASGPHCDAPIARVVPRVGVGISSQFKSYLARMSSATLPCVGKTWQELRAIEDAKTGAPNTTWPEGCAGVTKVLRPESIGGGVAQVIDRIAGTIGFAGLPEAEEKGVDTLKLENDGRLSTETKASALSASYAAPSAGGMANCGGITYDVPIGARRKPGESGLNADWSQVVGANPAVGGSSYPLCMLTYDIAFHGYSLRPDKKITFAREQTVRDYLKEYIVTPAGQSLLASPGSFYAPLPSAIYSSEDVLAAAQYAAGKISY